MRRVERTQRGLSLIEVVVGVVITGILSAGMFQATLIGMRTLDNTNRKIAGSNDTQLIAGYFTSDVASAEFVSTTGSLVHLAPSVSAPISNSMYVALWTAKRNTVMTAPDSMLQAYQVQSPSFTLQAANEFVAPPGPTGDRVTSSAQGTSSIGHAFVFSRSTANPIAQTGSATASTPSGASLEIARPAGAAVANVMLAHIAVAGGSATTVTAPEGWTLREERASGTSVRSLVYSRQYLSGDPASWTWSFAPDREAVGAIVSYFGVNPNAFTDPARNTDISPCGGETPALLMSWTDRGTNQATTVAYVGRSVKGEHQLVRQRCSSTFGEPADEAVLARGLAPSSVVASCSKPIVCGPLPVTVSLSLAEPPPLRESNGRAYHLRAATRTTT